MTEMNRDGQDVPDGFGWNRTIQAMYPPEPGEQAPREPVTPAVSDDVQAAMTELLDALADDGYDAEWADAVRQNLNTRHAHRRGLRICDAAQRLAALLRAPAEPAGEPSPAQIVGEAEAVERIHGLCPGHPITEATCSHCNMSRDTLDELTRALLRAQAPSALTTSAAGEDVRKRVAQKIESVLDLVRRVLCREPSPLLRINVELQVGDAAALLAFLREKGENDAAG